MNRKTVFWVTTLLIIMGSLSVFYYSREPRSKGKQWVIGIVNTNPGMRNTTLGFIQAMREQGYMEGQNVTYIRQETAENLEAALEEMKARPVDLLFTVTTPTTREVWERVNKDNIPIVFVLYDPLSSGLVNNLAEPGYNLTGVQIRGSVAKAAEWLTALAPGAKHIFVPVKYDTPAARQSLADLSAITSKLKLELTVAEVNSQAELAAVLATLPADIDALFVVCSLLIYENVKLFKDAAVAAGIPVASGTSLFEEGLTITFGHNSFHTGQQAGRLADRVLKGAKPGAIPVEVADFFLGINLKTAEESRVEVPASLLPQVDYVLR